ncbi:hypothetical protein, variant [Aphanomyces invadans]|uniref:Uncharacterized protein n=1 Tax=Aphanomyces invadans TaxID=157072 RepID=A0A024UDE0_9STRA|nr:hypothetical protein, variant [Aphanomyces invadans]ETW03658.1 hypothetical protein, variant [Aphanomyces invadans]|eukprot:XP_008867887.1 hypothetical protein, variant [Aphanomyces invadans]
MVVDQLRDATTCLESVLDTLNSIQACDATEVTQLRDQVRTLETQARESANEITRLRQQVLNLQEQLRDVNETTVHATIPPLNLSDGAIYGIGSTGDVVRSHADTIPSPKSPHGRTGFQDCLSDEENEEITTTLSHLVDHGNYDAVRHRASFSLVLRSDNVQDEFVPPHRTIRTKCHAKNSVQMKWARTTGPKTILLVKKPNELDVTSAMREVASWLMHEKGIRVFLEPKVHVEEKLAGTFTWSDDQDWQHKIDLVVSFGGDGTVLWVSNLFKTNVPPVFSFAMGSLGFLTPFEFSRADRSGGNEGPHYKGVPSLYLVQKALITLRQITWNGSSAEDSIYRCAIASCVRYSESNCRLNLQSHQFTP